MWTREPNERIWNAQLEVNDNQWMYAQTTKEVLGSNWVTTIEIGFHTFLFLVAHRTKEKGELELYSRHKVTKILGQSQLQCVGQRICGNITAVARHSVADPLCKSHCYVLVLSSHAPSLQSFSW